MKQFNGYYGCEKCKTCGIRIEKTLSYPYEEKLNLRTSAEKNHFAKEAVLIKNDVFGVKGPSALSEIVVDFIVTTAVDSMHCVYLGVTKRLMAIWFDSEFSITQLL